MGRARPGDRVGFSAFSAISPTVRGPTGPAGIGGGIIIQMEHAEGSNGLELFPNIDNTVLTIGSALVVPLSGGRIIVDGFINLALQPTPASVFVSVALNGVTARSIFLDVPSFSNGFQIPISGAIDVPSGSYTATLVANPVNSTLTVMGIPTQTGASLYAEVALAPA